MDPLGELKDSLAYLFELQRTKTQGEYINPLVQNLKKAIDNYQTDSPSALSALTSAVKKALPVIEKYVDSYTVKQKMDILAGKKGETINWYTLSRPGYSPRFQFASENLRTEGDFISWLSLRTGKDFTTLKEETQVRILTERAERKFPTKLGVYLRSNPDFLANLAMRSPRAFLKLINSRIALHMDTHQIAKAIQHHGSAMVDDKLNPREKAHKLIHFLDKKLSNAGHSIDKLLNDPKAKAELEKSWIFQIYQSKEYESTLRPNS